MTPATPVTLVTLVRMNEYVSPGMFWLALAIITAGLAEQKGRSRWVWFLLGLLLGPLATALVVVWAPPQHPVGRFAERVRQANALPPAPAPAPAAVPAPAPGPGSGFRETQSDETA